MDRFLRWLSERPRVSLTSLAVYASFIVLTHFTVQRGVLEFRRVVTRPVFNVLTLSAVAAALAGMTWWVVRNSRDMPNRDHRLRAWAAALILLEASYLYLIAQFSESAHYPQYAFLAVLLLATTRNYLDAYLLAALIAFVDEGFQYWGFRAESPVYYDFNDLLLNQVGTIVGLALVYGTVRTFEVRAPASTWPEQWRASWPLRLCTLLIVGGLLAFGAGVVQRYPDERSRPAWVVFDRGNDGNTDFWRGGTADKPVHRVTSTEGPLLFLGFVVGMVALNRPRRRHASDESATPGA